MVTPRLNRDPKSAIATAARCVTPSSSTAMATANGVISSSCSITLSLPFLPLSHGQHHDHQHTDEQGDGVGTDIPGLHGANIQAGPFDRARHPVYHPVYHLPIKTAPCHASQPIGGQFNQQVIHVVEVPFRSEEHTSELQSL